MLKQISCNKKNYEKKLFSYVNKGGIENKKRSKVVKHIIDQVKKINYLKFKNEKNKYK